MGFVRGEPVRLVSAEVWPGPTMPIRQGARRIPCG
jgi:hypothetical protein